MEGINNFIRKRFKKFRGHLKLSFGQSNRPASGSLLRNRSNFSYRYISFAQKNGLTLLDPLQISGEMGFCFMNVDSNHDSTLGYKLNKNKHVNLHKRKSKAGKERI